MRSTNLRRENEDVMKSKKGNATTSDTAKAKGSADMPELREIERLAVDLANLAGAEITTALTRILQVRYKSGSAEKDTLGDPVSEVDRNVEQLMRARVAERFTDHTIIGEEFDAPGDGKSDFVWAIDPIDGTANFVNGFPLFAASIGVLHKGRPVAGAVWCATSHTLRAGVYHGRIGHGSGAALKFDGDPVVPRKNPAVRRRLAGVPHAIDERGAWVTRKTGSAAIECAFVAAGLLEAAFLKAPNLWDVAGGVALVNASGGRVLKTQGASWDEFERFEPPPADGALNLRHWKRSLIIGRTSAEGLARGMAYLD